MTSPFIEASQAAMDSGEYLSSYETAVSVLARDRNEELDLTEADRNYLKYLAVLALARMGATAQAKSAYTDYGLHKVAGVDAAALDARIEKDIAISAPEGERAVHFLAAAERYQQVFESHGLNDYYPAINAASMFFLAGKEKRAMELARTVLEMIPHCSDDYWSRASTAEANLLIGDIAACIEVLDLAVQHPDASIANTASTRRQFKLLTDNEHVLAPLALPTIIHFAGHIISAPGKSGKFPAQRESEVNDRISKKLDELDVAIAYGSLAAGADIMIAEQVLNRGGELHAVLPFDEEEFVEVSVATAGKDWVQRFQRCLKRATSCTFSSTGPYNGNDALFHHCSVYAMGRACLRHQHLDAPVTQVVVWSGMTSDGSAGTSADKKVWQGLGYTSHTIPIQQTAGVTPEKTVAELSPTTMPQLLDPSLKAVLFGDVAGFSKLTDAQIPFFVERVLGCLAVAIKRSTKGNPNALLSINTWGDGIFVVFNNVLTAAESALAMQRAMGSLELPELDKFGAPQNPQLRLGAHFGPIFEFEDPMTKRRNYFGQHVNTAARIEPIAPQGEVYVTEAFAAHLSLDHHNAFQADYVGEMELAKEFGKARMYLLHEKSR